MLERAASVGGTWRDNTYPGVACDVPSHLYGFAAHPNPSWSGTYARGDEIRSYLEHVVEAEELGDRLRLRTAMRWADWDGADEVWRIGTGTPGAAAHGGSDDVIVADVLVLACGRLTEPTIPADRRTRQLSRTAVPLGPLGSLRRPRGRARRESSARGPARSRSCPNWRARRLASPCSSARPPGSCRVAATRTPTPIAPGSRRRHRPSRHCAPTSTPRARRASRRARATRTLRPTRKPWRAHTSNGRFPTRTCARL